MKIIPNQCGGSPHYWCTWMAQCSSFVRPGETGGMDQINETLMFGSGGWLSTYYPQIRQDLWLLTDAGWDMPVGLESSKVEKFYGGMAPDAERFPSLQGSPTEKLRKLHDMIQACGWRGTGVWLIAQGYGEAFGHPRLPDAQVEDDWRKKAQWSREAGIAYWKVDFGMRGEDLIFRRMLTRVAHEEEPKLVIEHARNQGPMNGKETDEECNPIKGVGRFRPSGFQIYRGGTLFETAAMLLHMSDIVRTYDVSWPLSTAITLDRITSLLEFGAKHPECTATLNCEDEPYLGAALGCALGILRFPQPKPEKPLLIDPHGVNQRMDEVVRAVRWSRISPSQPVNAAPVILDEKILVDKWQYEKGDVWEECWIGHLVKQGAPARISRGMPLPLVVSENEQPFVISSRHANGAVSVATLPRTIEQERRRSIPLADVTLEADPLSAPVGVFGRYRSLTLQTPRLLGNVRVWAQDLMDEEAREITSEVTISGSTLILSGALIERIGTSSATPDDESDPGLVLRITNF